MLVEWLQAPASEARKSLEVLGVAGSFDRNLRGSFFDLVQIG